jgi:hypothetical protein
LAEVKTWGMEKKQTHLSFNYLQLDSMLKYYTRQQRWLIPAELELFQGDF